MSSVGIIANPAASQDIRRVVTHAPSVSNHEKSNIVRRVLLGLAATTVETVWYLPDAAGITRSAADRLHLPFALLPLEGAWHGTAADTTAAAAQLAARGAGCVITLGGDGTARAAAKGSRDLPLLALSTGTNNAFPLHLEGTLAGMAAGSVATVAPTATHTVPLLELWRNGELVDLALVDVAAVDDTLGGRAVWEIERVRQIITTRTIPGTVGLSAIGGHLGLAPPAATAAVAVTIAAPETPSTIHPRIVSAPIAPGIIVPVPVSEHIWLRDGDTFDLPSGVALALDGERELMTRTGETWQVRVVAAGLRVVAIERALAAYAQMKNAE